MIKELKAEDLGKWSEPKAIKTVNGWKSLRKSPTTEEFWSVWKTNKDDLKAMGIGVHRDLRTNQWEIQWWSPIKDAPVEVQASPVEAKATMDLSRATDTEINLPAPKGCSYLGYQKAGIAYALGKEGVLIGDEMGLGKTIQGIGVINADPTLKKILIVCPVSLKINWHRELSKWLTRKLSIRIVEGSKDHFATTQDITIINFDILHKYQSVMHGDWDLVIIDESHKIKNQDTIRARSVLKIKAKKKIAMSGTPILNKPIELWTTLLWLRPDLWDKKKGYYTKRYCNAFHDGFGWNVEGHSNLDELQNVLRSTLMVRRLKKDVLKDLPAKQRQVIEIPTDDKIQQVVDAELLKYNSIQNRTDEAEKAQAEAEVAGDQEAYESAVERLREAQAVAFEEMALVRHATAVAKAPYAANFVKEILEEDEDKKIVVFAHHKDVVDILMNQLGSFNPVKITGDVAIPDRDKAVRTFQDPKSRCRVFIGNIAAAGVGLTLTASSHVVFAELDWVPGNVTQAEDRCHRIGQHDSVLVQHLVLEGSLDSRMAKTLVAKQKIADQALDILSGAPLPQPNNHTTIRQAEHQKATTDANKSFLIEVADIIPQSQLKAAHEAMQRLAAMCDGAASWDHAGFSKIDTYRGKELARCSSLNNRQGHIAIRLATKYRRQLDPVLVAQAKGEK